MIIRKSNKIPARDDATDIPPAGRVENCSAGSYPRAGAGSSTGSAPNSHPSISDHSPVSTKVEDSVCNDAADQSGTVVMIGHPFARPFLWIPVHSLRAAPKAEPRASP